MRAIARVPIWPMVLYYHNLAKSVVLLKLAYGVVLPKLVLKAIKSGSIFGQFCRVQRSVWGSITVLQRISVQTTLRFVSYTSYCSPSLLAAHGYPLPMVTCCPWCSPVRHRLWYIWYGNEVFLVGAAIRLHSSQLWGCQLVILGFFLFFFLFWRLYEYKNMKWDDERIQISIEFCNWIRGGK